MNHLPSLFLDRQGKSTMLGNLQMNGYNITGLTNLPINDDQVSNKKYVDNSISKSQIKPSHTLNNALKYIMDDMDQTSSEYGIEIDKIDNLEASFHSYNKRVIYLKLVKDGNDYDARIGYNIYQLVDKSKNKYYTAAIEWLTTDKNVWTKMEIFNNITSGSILSNQTEKFEDGKGLYYTRSIVQFEVFSITTPPVYLLSTIHIEEVNPTYPAKFSEVYNIIYGCNGKLNHVDPEVYDFHQAFEIDKTKMKMLVPLDLNNNSIINVGNLSYSGLLKITGKVFRIGIQNIFLIEDNFEARFSKIHLQWIRIHTTSRNKGDPEVLMLDFGNNRKTRYPFKFPQSGYAQITINRYFESIYQVQLIKAYNVPIILAYKILY